ALLDNVSLTLIDEATGLPAEVVGVDTGAAYPATLLSGTETRDAAGLAYGGGPGSYIYPILAAGSYRLAVEAPEGYLFPSFQPPEALSALPSAPFTLSPDGSYGRQFSLQSASAVSFDIPLDPAGALIVRKEALDTTASVGDLVPYRITLENNGDVPAPVLIRDLLPKGLRYQRGTTRLNGTAFDDPQIDATGRGLLFRSTAIVAPGESAALSYVVAVGPTTPLGTAINRAFAVNTAGEAISNRAEAPLIIEEDLLASRLTIIGRVAEATCSADDLESPQPAMVGKGVAGVRLYMETGRYVVSDENGQFHFEGIRPGSHVVQVDAATLPEGYEPVLCGDDTRAAGSALSRFVDARGGALWRANFYLKRIDAPNQPRAAQDGVGASTSETYSLPWLDQQGEQTRRWLYPNPGDAPDGRSVSLAFLHPTTDRIDLRLNGQPVPSANYTGLQTSSTGALAISRWDGVDLERGANRFDLVLIGTDGEVVHQDRADVWFVDEVERATLVLDQSTLVADGRTKPVVAVRLESGGGHAVHGGRLVEIGVEAPYRLAQTAEDEFANPIASAFSGQTATRVGADGIAYVELEPTLQSGRVRLQVELHSGATQDIEAWLSPEKREWVLVGLAEAEGLLSRVSGEGGRDLDEVMGDGRLAFFAKGVVRGDWLLTLAVDTAKRRGQNEGALFDEIDPNAYYTLYGDRTWQANDAESQYPVYVRVERGTFQALFGDYETGLTQTELGRYARRLSGLKIDYEGEQSSLTAFAAETRQGFVREEVAADGTSGPFRLRQAPLVQASEVIRVETRDRTRPDQILKTRFLSRYLDYEIDFSTGEIVLRTPV
ncbi:MAG: hypothetical protein AAGF20_12945, partial [Pseudomonadota bacterium]